MAQKCPCTLEDEDANMVHRERGGWLAKGGHKTICLVFFTKPLGSHKPQLVHDKFEIAQSITLIIHSKNIVYSE